MKQADAHVNNLIYLIFIKKQNAITSFLKTFQPTNLIKTLFFCEYFNLLTIYWSKKKPFKKFGLQFMQKQTVAYYPAFILRNC